jgi:hypothetical protein
MRKLYRGSARRMRCLRQSQARRRLRGFRSTRRFAPHFWTRQHRSARRWALMRASSESSDGPTLATLVRPRHRRLATLLAAWIEDLFAEAPVGAAWRLRRTLAHRGPRRPTLAGFVPICSRCTLVDLTPKYPTLATSTPGCLSRDLRPQVAGEAHRGLRVGGRRRRRLGLVMRVMG